MRFYNSQNTSPDIALDAICAAIQVGRLQRVVSNVGREPDFSATPFAVPSSGTAEEIPPSPRESSRHGEIGYMRRAFARSPARHESFARRPLAAKLIEPPSEAMWPIVPFRGVCPDTAIAAMWHCVRLSAPYVGFADYAACAAVNDAHFNTASRKRH